MYVPAGFDIESFSNIKFNMVQSKEERKNVTNTVAFA